MNVVIVTCSPNRLFPGGTRTVILDINEKVKRPVYIQGDIAFKLSHITSRLLRTTYDNYVRLIFHTGIEWQRQKRESKEQLSSDLLQRMKLKEGEFPLVFRKSGLDIAYKNDKCVPVQFGRSVSRSNHDAITRLPLTRRFRNDFRVEFIVKETNEPVDNRWNEPLYRSFLNTVRIYLQWLVGVMYALVLTT